MSNILGTVKTFSERQFHTAKHSEKLAYLAGFDCAINGANTNNCHFSLFARTELTRAWERGKRAGDYVKGKEQP